MIGFQVIIAQLPAAVFGIIHTNVPFMGAVRPKSFCRDGNRCSER
jgi:hypothetical protein